MAKPLHEKRRGWASATKGLAALALGALCIPMLTAAPAAQAVPEYDLIGEWVGAPTELQPGDLLSAQWNVSTNDDQAAAGNSDVENVVVTLSAAGGRFTAIPDACLLDGVDPVSALSNGNTTLTCNLGTQVEGTAAGVLVSIAADPSQGLDAITLTGEAGGKSVTLPPVPIVWGFGMDMAWGTPSAYINRLDEYVEASLQWTLSLEKGSVAGPDSVSYDLTVKAQNGSQIEAEAAGCVPFTRTTASSHPWSGGARPLDQKAPFVGSCTLTPLGGDQYRLVLMGIDYSLLQVPTRDSSGAPLPVDRDAVASGEIQFRVFTTTNTGLVLTSDAPIYTSANGQHTSQDDASTNTATKSIAFLGNYSAVWVRGFTGSGGAGWDDSYRATPGTKLRSAVSGYPQVSADGINGRCTVLDTKHVTFEGAATAMSFWDGRAAVVEDIAGGMWSYYVGSDPTVDPTSPSYKIMDFTCAGSAGWVDTLPSDKSTVKAVRVTYPRASADPYARVEMRVDQKVKSDTPVGQDIWTISEVYRDSAWGQLSTSSNGTQTLTPDAVYPHTATTLDIVRIVGATPVVNKSVDRATVKPGDEAAFTLKYSANVSLLDADPIDNFVLTDTLPVGMEYVAGSATPEPVVSTNAGQQVLTWTLNGVAANAEQALTYNAVAGGGAAVGIPLVNTVDAVINSPNWPAGVSQPKSSSKAQVVQTTNGYTSIGKTADQAFIPNIAGDGVGAGSWTVTLKSFDPVSQAYTDTIDVLPYNGDGRGTAFSGSYAVTGVDAAAGAEVYVTTVDPATLSDDPNDAMNGTAGNTAGNTVNWTLVDPAADFPAGVTAIRVIGSKMAPGATQAFTVHIKTACVGTGPEAVCVKGGDVFVNRAQARAEHTKLLMRTSAALPVAPYYSASLKKYVQAADGTWHDANTVEDYPTFHPGDEVKYRITVENTGQGELTNIVIADDKQPTLGKHTIASLAPGDSESHEYTVTLGSGLGTLVNTASATAAESPVGTTPEINTDPAGIEIVEASVTPVPDTAFGNVVLEKRLEGLNATDAAVKNQVFKIDVTCQAPSADGSAGEVLWTGTVKIKGGQKKLLIDETGQARVLPGGTRCYAAETDRGGADRTTIANDSWDNALVVTGGTQENPQRLHLVVTNTFGPTSLAMTGFAVGGVVTVGALLIAASLILLNRRRRLNA